MLPYPERRKDWTKIRFEYYSSGRLTFMNGFFFSGAILLAYTIETCLQSIAYEFYKGEKYNEKKWRKHDVLWMFNELKSIGILNDIIVSQDFIKFISYNFKRYPGQLVPKQKEMTELYGGSHIGAHQIHYFDDFIIQLDREIYNLCGDKKVLMPIHSFELIDSVNSLSIFSENKKLQTELEFYLGLLNADSPKRVKEIKTKLSKYGNFETLEMIINFSKIPETPVHLKNIFREFKPEEFELPKQKGIWNN